MMGPIFCAFGSELCSMMKRNPKMQHTSATTERSIAAVTAMDLRALSTFSLGS